MGCLTHKRRIRVDLHFKTQNVDAGPRVFFASDKRGKAVQIMTPRYGQASKRAKRPYKRQNHCSAGKLDTQAHCTSLRVCKCCRETNARMGPQEFQW